jgi:16S rRNA (cytidine1402-2'-O)-methyltransferase
MASNSLGLPADIPQRSLEAVRLADLLVFEENKGARLVLKAAGVTKTYLRLSEHAEIDTITAVKKALMEGLKVVYMSDQGTPTVADPGRLLLETAYTLDADIRVVPGPSSIMAALSACPFLTNQYLYRGFLDREPEKRRKEIEQIAKSTIPVVILDTPYRRKALLSAFQEIFEEDRRIFLAEDMSGESERFLIGTPAELLEKSKEKLNFVLVVSPALQTVAKKPALSHRPCKKERASHKANMSEPPRRKSQQSVQQGAPQERPSKYRSNRPKR